MTIRPALALLTAVSLAVFPFIASGYLVFQGTSVLIYAIAIMGLYILTGINGQISIGHGAFFALGAYAHAILMTDFGLPFIISLPLSALICFAAGYLFGWPALRLEGLYLALGSFALAVAAAPILKLSFLEGWTGGVQGLFVPAPQVPEAVPLTQDQWLYLIVLAVGCVLYAGVINLAKSRSGRAMMAIRDNSVAARAMGVNVAWYKTMAFGLSAAYSGVAGGLSASVVQFVAPDTFNFFLSVYILVGLMVGGLNWPLGCLIGGAFLVFVPNFAEGISPALAGATYGLVMILLILLAPKGVGGIIESVFAYFSKRQRVAQS